MLPAASFQRCVWRAVPVVLSLLFSPIGRAQADQLAGTMPEDYFPELKSILATASRRSPQMILREIEVAEKDAETYRASSQMLPSFGGDAHYDENAVRRADQGSAGQFSRDSGLFYSFSLSQALFHWGELKNNNARARIEVAIAEKNAALGWRGLVVELRRAYLGLVAKKAYLRFLRYSLDQRKQELDALSAAVKEGKAAAAAEAGKTVDYREQKLFADRAESDFIFDREHFARVTGIGTLKEEAIPDEIPLPLYKADLAGAMLANLLRSGGRSTFEAQIAEMEIRKADLRYKVERVRLLPKFNLGAGYSLQNSTTVNPGSVSQTAIAQETLELNAHWAIFDGFATKGAKAEAIAEKRAAQMKLQQATDSALEQAQRMGRAVALDAQGVELARTRREGGEVGLRQAREDIQLGKVPPSALGANTMTLYQQQWNEIVARAQFLGDWSEFVSLAADDPSLQQLPSRYVREKR